MSNLNPLVRRSAFLIAVSGVFGGLLAGCASGPTPDVRREASLAPLQSRQGGMATGPEGLISGQKLPEAERPRPNIRRGTGQMINHEAASAAPIGLPTTGGATFNFEGESLHAVVRAILGDMLGQNYVIAPDVKGTVTLGTPKPVSAAEALSLLEMMLGWNNARLIYSDHRYNIVPADQAMSSGMLGPRTGAPSLARGYEVRSVPLRHISASEMEKVLKPYARPSAVVSVDNARNVINIAGTRTELENYLHTIEIFDVDWLAGMSVGVFPLVSGKASNIVADLEKVFGEQSKSPIAGMLRFMPLDGANAVLVITPQPSYLDDIQEWLDRIDSVGGDIRLFSFDLRHVEAKGLVTGLVNVLRGAGRTTTFPAMGGANPPSDDDSIRATTDGERGSTTSYGSANALLSRQSGVTGQTATVDLSRITVSAIDETNSIIVRCTPSEWGPIKDAIAKLDVMPLQVQIEAQVATVQLGGDLSYGVNWFFEKAVTDAGLPSAVGRTTWSQLAGNIESDGVAWTFIGRNAAAVITALDAVTDVQLLQTPSVVVRNNAEASLNVGSRIPIASVTFNPGSGTDGTVRQVQYLDTGTTLKLRPRVSREGTVFLDITQEISSPVGQPDENGNVRIDTRKLKTEVAVESGDTIMLAGLIDDSVSRGSSGLPGLSRIPVIGGLFGRRTSSTQRSETIVLITPTIIRNPQEARDLTDEYGQNFRGLHPLRAQ